MRLAWTYELPEHGDDAPDSGEAPLYWDGESVLLPVHRFEHGRTDRGADPAKRGYVFDVHRVSVAGSGTIHSFRAPSALIPQMWSFLRFADDLVLHVGTFHTMPGGNLVPQLPFVDASNGAGRGLFLSHDGRIIFADNRSGRVFCHGPQSKAARWILELPSAQRRSLGRIDIQDGRLVCSASDALLFVDLDTGSVEREVRFPRIDKLYPPVQYGGDRLFPFENHTSGGLVRVDSRGGVRWRFTKRGAGGPPRGGPLPVIGQTAILSVNGGSSLVGVDLESGLARWTFRAQWLYTPIEIHGTSIIFGTSGGYGRHLRCHDAGTGEPLWAVQMDGGCPYYARQSEHCVAGDWGGFLRRVNCTNGEVTDQIALGGRLTGPPLVVGDRVYKLWSPKGTGRPALVAIDC